MRVGSNIDRPRFGSAILNRCSAILQKYASDPRPPPHTRQKYEQTSGQNMTPNALKQGKFGSLGAIFLFIFLPCIWRLGLQKESLGGRFGYFLFFPLGGGAGEVRGARKGRGRFFIENPRGGGGSPTREGAEGRGAGRVSAGILLGGGGGVNIFFGAEIPTKTPTLLHWDSTQFCASRCGTSGNSRPAIFVFWDRAMRDSRFCAAKGLGGPGPLLSGLFFAPASEIKKSENWKIKNGASEMIFRAGTAPVQNTEMGRMKNSFFEGHEVIWIPVTRRLPGQITEMFRPRTFRFAATFRDSSVLVGQR